MNSARRRRAGAVHQVAGNTNDKRKPTQLPIPTWYGCYNHCRNTTDKDSRPWLLITGRRHRIPLAVPVCPDCEESTAHLGDELDDLIGVRLPDNTEPSIAKALRGWPVRPKRQ